MSMTEFEKGTQELADELAPKWAEVAEMAARYWALKQARRVTADGDVLGEKEYDAECARLREHLMGWIDRNGALEDVEGVPPLFVQPRADVSYDVKTMAQDDPQMFARLLDLGCVTLSKPVLKAQQAAGNIVHTVDRYAIKGETRALMFGKEKP